MADKWETYITKVKTNEIRLRGFRIEELMGRITFTEAICLLFTGEIPDIKTGKLLEAIFISSIDHGVTPPSALAARTASSTGAPLNGAVAAGLLSINEHHGGAIYNCMTILQNAINAASNSTEYDQVASALVVDAIQNRTRIPGFGHRIHRADPRTEKLFELAASADLAGSGFRMIKAIEQSFIREDKKLPINVDGAIAAILIDMHMPHELANAFFMISRVPGLFAHAYEEKVTQKPMRHIRVEDHIYSGKDNRSFIKRKE